MERHVAKKSGVKVPRALATLFANPALVGDETREDYDELFHAIVAVVIPKDAIAWLFAGRITDLSWEPKRERNLKRLVLKYAFQGEVRRLLTPPEILPPTIEEQFQYFREEVDPEEIERLTQELDEATRQWANDPEARGRIDKKLADQGYDNAWISSEALRAAADEIDAIDRRIASYELRWMTAVRASENYTESLARRLKAASSEIIDGEFTEAAE
jgi:hypothetical protein